MNLENSTYNKGLRIRLRYTDREGTEIVKGIPDQFWDVSWDLTRTAWLTQHHPGWTNFYPAPPSIEPVSCVVNFAGWRLELVTTPTGDLGVGLEKHGTDLNSTESHRLDVVFKELESKALSATLRLA